jgi:para-nitrobenzyl esterase
MRDRAERRGPTASRGPCTEDRSTDIPRHFSELPFVWKNFDDPFTRMFYPADMPIPKLANQMHAAWVTFTKGRQPMARGLPDWPRYSAEGERARETMMLNDRSELLRDPAGIERALWDGIL